MTRDKYLRRVSCVSGKECDGTLREVDSAYAESNKVVPQAYNLSLMRGQVFFCCFSGGSEYDSTRNNEPPAMPVSLSCFSFKQKTSYATMNVVPQPHYVTRR